MLYRKLETDLDKWKDNLYRKPLILRGARQVGKTSLVRKWGKVNYEELVEINLEKKSNLDVFDKVESVPDFIKSANIIMGKKIFPGKSLIFIDEVQESKNIMELLRFFAEERPDLHLIAAGSLLEAKMAGKWNVPVGRVEYMYLFPMTFFEYLKSVQKGNFLEQLENAKMGQEIIGTNFIENHFKDYILIGGMPSVVNEYVETGNFSEIKNTLSDLITSYDDDIGKYAVGSKRKYVEAIFKTAPRYAGQLFNYENFGDLGYKSREVSEAIQRLEQVRLLHQVKAINSISTPISYKHKRAKKMIWLDNGLANQANDAFQSISEGNYQGRIMEQMVGQTLIASGVRRKFELAYWSRNKDEGSAEVDFCWQHENKIVGLEVKSGNTKNLKSLFSMMDIGGDKVIPVRVSWDELGVEKYLYNGKNYKVLSIPFYLLERIDEFLG
ncbi:AAA family ATPase [Patescibacteria group bacterium]|nr:AAA family ATPase [Patescibacteria group bacterium]MBU1499674.1 AAA family ATPase [Patescibacteria group bacterium]